MQHPAAENETSPVDHQSYSSILTPITRWNPQLCSDAVSSAVGTRSYFRCFPSNPQPAGSISGFGLPRTRTFMGSYAQGVERNRHSPQPPCSPHSTCAPSLGQRACQAHHQSQRCVDDARHPHGPRHWPASAVSVCGRGMQTRSGTHRFPNQESRNSRGRGQASGFGTTLGLFVGASSAS